MRPRVKAKQGEGDVMSGPQPEINALEKNLCGIANLRWFKHSAMAAAFDVFIVYRDAGYAKQAVWAAFEELGRIESNLSRFVENSDVSRINSLGKGHPLQIGPAAFECIQISIEMSRQTNGAFDITAGSLHTGSNLLKLNESDHTIELLTEGIQIDLGAIGKGYAADKMGQLLRDWGVDIALISAGQSSTLPIGVPPEMPGWPVTLSNPADYSHLLAKMYLSGRALSVSGIRKGPHIIDPRSREPTSQNLSACAAAQTAAAADALSTAFMVMSAEEVRTFCKAHNDVSALLCLPGRENNLVRFGQALF
jgi:thiamine biosynthesis lipoprotein